MSATVRGLAAQAFMSGPRCPDLLVPRHVRIHQHAAHSPVPHVAAMAATTSVEPLGAVIAARVALEHDQRGCAGRMCCREQRRCRERPVHRDEDRFATPEIVQHRGDAVGPLLQRRQRARRDGIGRSRARLVEEDQPAERCHRLDPPSKGRQLRKVLAAREPVRDEHDVARSFVRRAIGDAQIAVSCVARLREHCGSLSRAASLVSASTSQLEHLRHHPRSRPPTRRLLRPTQRHDAQTPPHPRPTPCPTRRRRTPTESRSSPSQS